MIIAPSILSANFGYLADACHMINESQADWFHVDVMDGKFVPNISFGFPVIKAVKVAATKPLDVHLMIEQPERYIEMFADAGAAIISVHIETCPHLHRTVQQIKASGCKAGVAINPHLPIEMLRDILPDIDLVCMMSVNPGFGGQTFIPGTLGRIRRLVELKLETHSHALIEIDGGVTLANAAEIAAAGAQVLVAGNTVFSAEDPLAAISQLKEVEHRNYFA
jgi:ribulose-phosphate 3-epimerase